MKILLDENIDIRFSRNFPSEHEVFTVRDMGWNGVKNGELLKLLRKNKFDYWIVVDKNIPYQQNIKELLFSIIVLDVYRNTLKNLEPFIPAILDVFVNSVKGEVIVLEEGS